MITKRLALLQILLLGGFCAVFALPSVRQEQPSGVKLALPEFVGEWYGQDALVTEMEKTTLGPSTEFARKVYTNGRGDQLFVSIVLSGQDMNTSLHRPERCLPAQGWTLIDSSRRAIVIPGPPKHHLTITRLHNFQYAHNLQGELIRDPKGEPISLFSLNYYWFVGYHDVSASHGHRMMLDLRDRILHGYNQRWAYITVVSSITQGLVPFGKDEPATDALIQSFIKQVTPQITEPSVQY